MDHESSDQQSRNLLDTQVAMFVAEEQRAARRSLRHAAVAAVCVGAATSAGGFLVTDIGHFVGFQASGICLFACALLLFRASKASAL